MKNLVQINLFMVRIKIPKSFLKVVSLEIGSNCRKAFIIDHVFEKKLLDPLYSHFKNLKYDFKDSDRPDTRYVKHLVHNFKSQEWKKNNSLPNKIATIARDFLIKQKIHVGSIQRIYANFNLYGDFQFSHTDGDEWTALFFLNSEWKEDWGGEFILYDETMDGLGYSIQPKPGRLVIFDGMIPHRGGVPSKLCYDPRISLAVKFRR
jgi:SM-20-related protein